MGPRWTNISSCETDKSHYFRLLHADKTNSFILTTRDREIPDEVQQCWFPGDCRQSLVPCVAETRRNHPMRHLIRGGSSILHDQDVAKDLHLLKREDLMRNEIWDESRQETMEVGTVLRARAQGWKQHGIQGFQGEQGWIERKQGRWRTPSS